MEAARVEAARVEAARGAALHAPLIEQHGDAVGLAKSQRFKQLALQRRLYYYYYYFLLTTYYYLLLTAYHQ